MRKYAFLLPLLLMMPLACTRKSVQVEVVSPLSLSYDAMCQRDSIVFTSDCAWSAESGCDWVTLERETGSGDGLVPLYIQQNDSGADRQGYVKLHFDGGDDVVIRLCQDASDLNSYSVLVNLPKTYGVGWGYDYSIDHADISGVRGQIVDEARLTKDSPGPAVIAEAHTYTRTESVSEESCTELLQKMSSKFTGGVDLKVASGKVSGEFSKQISENKDRLYVWYRDIRAVKQAYMDTDGIAESCMTADFKDAVKKLRQGGDVREFVRKYGTHFIRSSTLGGKFDWYFTVSREVRETVEKMVLTINVKLLFWKKSTTKVDESVWSQIKKDFIASFEVTGGGDKGRALNRALQTTAAKGVPLSDPELITRWQECFVSPKSARDEELTMIDFEVCPIWEIVESIDEAAADRLRDYIVNEYLK